MGNTTGHILVAIIIWLSAVAGVLGSYFASKNKRLLGLGNTFGGGVLLAAGLVHLTNDAFEEFDNADEDSWCKRYNFPWAAFFVSMGFVITLLIEVTVLHLLDEIRDRHDDSNLKSSLIGKDLPTYSEFDHHQSLPSTSATATSRFMKPRSISEAMSSDSTFHGHPGVGDAVEQGLAVAIVFFCAISCHSFIAGLGVGALSGNEMWSGMIAIIMHKGLASFTLANCFNKSKSPTLVNVLFMLAFSIVTPVGIMLGMLITQTVGPTEGILIGLAGGSFLYIGIIEVISKEMESPDDWRCKLLVLIVGWGLMSMLAIWV